MKRKTFDVMVSSVGIFLAAVLLVAGGLLTWANRFVGDEVHNQLAAQKIYFPAANSPAIAGPQFAAMHKYAGELMTAGAQAQVYADHYIAVHLKEIGAGKTYSQLSAQAQADPTDTKLADTVQTMFRGETLRGLLLNAYAFATMGTIAGIAAICAFVSAAVMLVLGGLGLWHSRRVSPEQEVLSRRRARSPDAAAG